MRVMSPRWNRRDVLKGLLAASAAMIVPEAGRWRARTASGTQVEIQITPVSASYVSVEHLSREQRIGWRYPTDGSLVKKSWGAPIAKLRTGPTRTISARRSPAEDFLPACEHRGCERKGDVIQQLAWDESCRRSFLSEREFATIRFRARAAHNLTAADRRTR